MSVSAVSAVRASRKAPPRVRQKPCCRPLPRATTCAVRSTGPRPARSPDHGRATTGRADSNPVPRPGTEAAGRGRCRRKRRHASCISGPISSTWVTTFQGSSSISGILPTRQPGLRIRHRLARAAPRRLSGSASDGSLLRSSAWLQKIQGGAVIFQCLTSRASCWWSR